MTTQRQLARRRINVSGIVQGVGFRPFVYRLARSLSLGGFVSNDSAGVLIEIEGPAERVEQFYESLVRQSPPLAHIDDCRFHDLPPIGEADFAIRPSDHDTAASTQVSPDVATCDDCLGELFDPADRRYRYPFINCTNCGPRYTIVDRIPYDRAHTSMKVFPMCADCAREYGNPSDRRFHAQPNACPVCGPRLWVHDGKSELSIDDPVAKAVQMLRDGKIVAVRGVGGFHLAVDATNETAVLRLRERKLRAEKPLAMMAPDLENIRRFCHVDADEEVMLRHHTRSIVLLRRREDTAIAPSVVYDNRYFGFMLPYTPLHHLILKSNFPALVMTSGNLAEEPIAIGNDEALERLTGIADCFLLHNREIRQRCDDSIARLVAGRRQIVRRARGFVPEPVTLTSPSSRPILACGGELKNTIGLSRGNKVFLSQHIGDLDNPSAFAFFENSIIHLKALLEIEPELVACDLHPEYLSTKWALRQSRLPSVGVQHHHAHLVSVMADNGVTERTIGLILDGTGYGTDGTIWGGEVLVGDAVGFERLAWLTPVAMPGGTAAVRQPWRMMLSYLYHVHGQSLTELKLPGLAQSDHKGVETILLMIKKGLNCPMTSSCGRLFDGVAAILGLGHEVTYEAQAAIKLEMAASAVPLTKRQSAPMESPEVALGLLPIDSLIRRVVSDVEQKLSVEQIASRFHVGLAELFVGAARSARSATGLDRVALSGGVYQNTYFFEYILGRLLEEKFDVLYHRNVPANDGGLALGQVVIADAMTNMRT